MRVTIKGLTDSTITFNTLGIILRGKIEARSIDIKNDEQLRELNTIKNARMISVETEGEYLPQPTEQRPIIQSIRERQQAREEMIKKIEEPKVSQPEQPEQPEQSNVIEDGPTPKRGRGRPKGSVKKVEKPIGEKKPILKASIKTIKKVESDNPTSINDAQESEVTVMTPGGPIKGRTQRSFTGEMPESEATKASIEALKQIETEESENEELPEVDESKLDPSERMGNKSVIATGLGGNKAIEMKNSILPEAEQVRKAVKFIELKDETAEQKEKSRIKNAFIDGLDDVEDPDGDIES